jgi:hypothetical protein
MQKQNLKQKAAKRYRATLRAQGLLPGAQGETYLARHSALLDQAEGQIIALLASAKIQKLMARAQQYSRPGSPDLALWGRVISAVQAVATPAALRLLYESDITPVGADTGYRWSALN